MRTLMFVLTVAVFGTIVQPCFAVPVVFSDGIFDAPDWSLTSYVRGHGGTADVTQEITGGNPDEYRRVRINVNAPDQTTDARVFTFHQRADETYDPGTQGSILSIDYSEDAICLECDCCEGWGMVQNNGPAIWQGGRIYFHVSYIGTTSTWHSIDMAGLEQDDFILFSPEGSDPNQHPDFSTDGSVIEFGFYRATGQAAHSGGVACFTIGGIDNWSLTVYPYSPANLSVEKSGPTGSSTVGDTLAYNLTVTNNGPGDATAVLLEDFLPTGISFVSAVWSQGSCSESNGVVTCDLDTIIAGDSATVEIVGILDDWLLLNTVSVSSTELDLDLSNNADSVVICRDCASAALPRFDKQEPMVSFSNGRPNPFNPKTTISFTVDKSRPVEVAVFGVTGRQVAVLVDKTFEPGSHAVTWDGKNADGRAVAPGTYIMRMESQGLVKSRKVTLIR